MEREELIQVLSDMGIEVFEKDGTEVVRLSDLIKATIQPSGESLEMEEMSDTEQELELSEEERLEMAEDIADETPGLNLDFSDNENLDMP